MCDVQEAAKGDGALAAAGTKTRGLSIFCLYKMPPTPDGGHQARCLSRKDRSQAGYKQVRVAEEARRAREAIVAATAFMKRHLVGDKVARRSYSSRDRLPNSC